MKYLMTLLASTAMTLSLGASATAGNAAPASLHADRAAQENLSCSSVVASHRFVRGTSEYEAAMAFHDANAAFPAGVPKARLPRDAKAVFLTVEQPVTCGEKDAEASKWSCETTGCTEEIIGTTHMPTGSKLSLETCTGGYKTTITWTKNADGSWTVTKVNSEQSVGCNPIG